MYVCMYACEREYQKSRFPKTLCIGIIWVLEFNIDAHRPVGLRVAALCKGPGQSYSHANTRYNNNIY